MCLKSPFSEKRRAAFELMVSDAELPPHRLTFPCFPRMPVLRLKVTVLEILSAPSAESIAIEIKNCSIFPVNKGMRN